MKPLMDWCDMQQQDLHSFIYMGGLLLFGQETSVQHYFFLFSQAYKLLWMISAILAMELHRCLVKRVVPTFS